MTVAKRMNWRKLGALACVLSLSTTASTFAALSFNSGESSVTLIHSGPSGSSRMVTQGSVPFGYPGFPLSSAIIPNSISSPNSQAQGGVGQFSFGNIASLLMQPGTGVDQFDPAGSAGESTLRVNYTLTWDVVSTPLGPPLVGYANVPLSINVPAGAGQASAQVFVRWQDGNGADLRVPFNTGKITFNSSTSFTASAFPAAFSPTSLDPGEQFVMTGFIQFGADQFSSFAPNAFTDPFDGNGVSIFLRPDDEYQTQTLAKNPILYYRFEEQEQPISFEGGPGISNFDPAPGQAVINHATTGPLAGTAGDGVYNVITTSGITVDVPGADTICCQAVTFNDDLSNVQSPPIPDVIFENPFGIEVWLKTASFPSEGVTTFVDASDEDRVALTLTGSGNVEFFMNDGVNNQLLFSSPAIVENEWAHIFVRRDGDSVELFINGMLEDQADLMGVNFDFDNFDNGILLGDPNLFGLMLDEFALYGAALTDEQIMQQFQTGHNPDLEGFFLGVNDQLIVPEPASAALLVLGVGAIGLRRRRSRA